MAGGLAQARVGGDLERSLSLATPSTCHAQVREHRSLLPPTTSIANPLQILQNPFLRILFLSSLQGLSLVVSGVHKKGLDVFGGCAQKNSGKQRWK